MKGFWVIALAAIALQTGCVTGRRTLALPVIATNGPAVVQGHVFIASIVDNRVFQNSPPDPSTPSIDGDVTKVSAQQKSRMIGRQRNGFGHAMGDIGLADGDSVTIRTRLLVEQGLRELGYQVTSGPSAAANSVAVSIDKFWAWMTPGFFALSFEAQIQCRISVTNRSGTTTSTIKGYALNHGQVAKNENWLEAFDPAFEDFTQNFSQNAASLGLLSDLAATAVPKDKPPPATDIYEQLKKLDELRKSGVLTEAEFETQKAKVLAN